MPYRFVHTADIHLDSPLRSLALRNPDLAELIGNATRRAFTTIIDICIEEQVDALMIVGDLYDGDQTSMKTAGFLAAQIRRLDQAGTRVFIVRGNHDALSKITKELILPEAVKVFGGRAEIVTLDRAAGGLDVAVHGISFSRPHAPDSLLPKFKAPVDGAVNIGLMHTSIAGAPGHDVYAPCGVSDLTAAGFDYWGLGHVHKREIHSATPAIVMPGMPQGRDINEAGAKSVTLVTIGDDRSVHLDERLTCVAQFERVPVDLSDVGEWRDMVASIGAALEKARERTSSDHLVARLSVTGATPLAWRIRRDADLLKEEADARATAIGNTWVEKIEVDCLPPATEASTAVAMPIVELRELITNEVAGSDVYKATAREIVQELQSQLPLKIRRIFGEDEVAFNKIVERLTAEGCEDVLARLRERIADEEAV